MTNPSFVFFGTPQFAVTILEELKVHGLLPRLIVTAPDKPQGRHLTLTPPPVKVWAENQQIPFLQPEKIGPSFLTELQGEDYLFIVAAYGKILSRSLLDKPKHGVLNVHPSLLPLYRGSSPIEAPILRGDAETGVSIMLLDEEMDHGPILEARSQRLEASTTGPELEDMLAHVGGKLLAETIPQYITGTIVAKAQDHTKATYTKKVIKEDGALQEADSNETKWRKYRAYKGWPGTYFFVPHGNKTIRVKIADAVYENDIFSPVRVIPEGKKEMSYEEFLRGLK